MMVSEMGSRFNGTLGSYVVQCGELHQLKIPAGDTLSQALQQLDG